MAAAGEAIAYPFEAYDGMRVTAQRSGLGEGEPLVRVRLPFGGDGWLARRYTDVRQVLTDPRFSRQAAFGRDVPRAHPLIRDEPGTMDLDPPEHTRLRRLVSMAFSTARVERIRPQVQRIIDEFLDGILAAGAPADLMETVCWPFSVAVICDVLGIPPHRRSRLRGLIDVSVGRDAFPPDEIRQARLDLRDGVAALVTERQERLDDDIISALIRARFDDDRLTAQELVELSLGILMAGLETPANQLGNFVYTLLTHPDELAKLRDRPELIGSAVEELTRHVPIGASANHPRIALEDMEFGGVLIRAGDAVFVDFIAANRDPRVFADPDLFDITREVNPHVGYGHGVHRCLGARLAQMELQVAVSTVVRRLPGLRLAVEPDDVPWKMGRVFRGPSLLTVTWDSAGHC
ncbi:cytochrome P450 [Mangrovihabitans endophyticus]|uniref:Cytochrome P450 n=1 Tax=Mangrovihabitans endophyticus TaxID=1751298 RepID=A0A8J3C006_9ACTN|nr:cytochrome P450 [Mangrovihabitans endophyticus]GGK90849.1 cytochrome P450 [Mangrovihabitans endophyticus]